MTAQLRSHLDDMKTLAAKGRTSALRHTIAAVTKLADRSCADETHAMQLALGYAAHAGHVQCVQVLLDHGTDPAHGDWGPLRYACRQGWLAVVACLLQHPSCPSADTAAGAAMLHAGMSEATTHGKVPVLRAMLQHSMVDWKPGWLDQLLLLAVSSSREAALRLLVLHARALDMHIHSSLWASMLESSASQGVTVSLLHAAMDPGQPGGRWCPTLAEYCAATQAACRTGIVHAVAAIVCVPGAPLHALHAIAGTSAALQSFSLPASATASVASAAVSRMAQSTRPEAAAKGADVAYSTTLRHVVADLLWFGAGSCSSCPRCRRRALPGCLLRRHPRRDMLLHRRGTTVHRRDMS